MSVHHKPPEVLQAQVAAFAQEQTSRLEYGKPKVALYQHLGQLADGPVEDFDYSVQRNIWNAETRQMAPAETEHTIPAPAYLEHLRRIGGSRSVEVSDRASYLRAYQEFQPEITSLLATLPADESSRLNHDAALGSGLSVIAFSLRHDDKDYIVKVSRTAHKGAANADARLRDLMQGKGIGHIEQLAAISYEQGVAVTERVPGKDMSQLAPEELNQISQEHIEQGLQTLAAMQAAGLAVDTKAGNVMFDPNAGFGFIDYSLDRQVHGEAQPFRMKANALLWSIAGVDNHEHLRNSAQDYQEEAADYKARAGVLQRFREACLHLGATYDLNESLYKVNEFLDNENRFVHNVETPGWVEEQLIRNKERQQADELANSAPANWE